MTPMTLTLPALRVLWRSARSPVAQWPATANFASSNASMCSSAPASAQACDEGRPGRRAPGHLENKVGEQDCSRVVAQRRRPRDLQGLRQSRRPDSNRGPLHYESGLGSSRCQQPNLLGSGMLELVVARPNDPRTRAGSSGVGEQDREQDRSSISAMCLPALCAQTACSCRPFLGPSASLGLSRRACQVMSRATQSVLNALPPERDSAPDASDPDSWPETSARAPVLRILS